jgi:hypothetical protein
MPFKVIHVSPMLAAAAVATAVAVVPLATAASDSGSAPAAPQQSCAGSGLGTLCQSPGNVQINDAPPPVQFYPYGGEALLL